MRRSVEETAEAEADALEAFKWYLDNALTERPALRFRDELKDCYRRIGESPERYPIYRRNTRRALLHSYPYGVIFRIEPKRVVVIALMHLRRRPGYGTRRRTGTRPRKS